jgi:ABC-2 type transport system permease protein
MAANPYGLRYPQGGLKRHLGFIWHYFKTNLQIGLEYRAAFISKAFGMLLNDVIWLVYWWVFFTRFPQASGYGVREALTLWVFSAFSVGWSFAIFGNLVKLATVISSGGLDYYLALPKNVLLHVLISRMDIEAWGDLTFALFTFWLLYQPGPDYILLLLVLGFLSGLVFASFVLIAQSLAFFLGNTQSLSDQLCFALITFSNYPSHLFRGLVKAAVFTVIPAAFVSYVPVELLREFRWELFGLLALIACGFVGLAVGIFYLGLRRYESGNLFQMRS